MFHSNKLPVIAAKILLRHSISWHRDRENASLQEDRQNHRVESSSRRKFTAGKKSKYS